MHDPAGPLGAVVGAVEFPSLGCQARLRLLYGDESALALQAEVLAGDCFSAKITLTATGDKALRYDVHAQDNCLGQSVTAPLSPA